MYDRSQKTQQLARGEGKIIDIHCIGTSGKTVHSARPIFDLLLHIWKRGIGRGENVPWM